MTSLEEYVQNLVDLGLTVIQAKTLLALGAQNYRSAGSISKFVKVGRQQIYRAHA
jgi:sugar-specific transcriptional regulator TrmB